MRDRAPVWILLLLLVAGCGSSSPPPRGIELELGDGQAAPSEYHRVPLRLSRARSIFAPSGLLLEAELRRPSGARARLVLDLPTAPGAGEATAPPVVSYTEHDAGARLLFQAARAAGRVELSADPGCPCQTGRLELLLTDSGPDALLGTADDRQRRVGSARIRLDERPFCHTRGPISIREDLLVVGARACPVSGRGGGQGGVQAWSCGGGWAGAAWNQDRWYDEAWTGDWEEGFEDGWDESWTDGYVWDPEQGTWVDGDGNPGQGANDDWESDEGWDEDAWESDDGWEGGDDGWESGDDGWDSGDGWSDDGGSWDDDGWGTDDDAGDSSWGDDSGSDSDDGWDD